MKYQAHRGVQKEYPENTMIAFKKAVEQGYDIIELDPSVTKDGVFVLLHDGEINRTARDKNGNAPKEQIKLSDITYKQAEEYEYGSWFDEKFKGESLPLFKDVLKFSVDNGIRLKVDCKYEYFSPENQKAFFDTFDYDCHNITFNCTNEERAKELVNRFKACSIAFDGVADEKKLMSYKNAVGDNDLEIWMPIKSELTSWWQGDFLTKENVKTVEKYAKLCVWILEDEKQLEKVTEICTPYAIETTGGIKPKK